jgi:glucose/arabinose dehydrogenase
MRAAVVPVVVLALSAASLSSAPVDHAYRTSGATCDGWPRAPIGMADGYCAGIVVAPPAVFGTRTLKFPRTLLQLNAREWLVNDLVGWSSAFGAVYRMTASSGQPVKLVRVLSRLNMPHGLARGPDGGIYVGEMSRIFRFDPNAADPRSTIVPVVTGLPDNRLHANRHPLSFFIFDGNGDLLVNVGAPSDQCATRARTPNGTAFCIESEGAEKTAGVRRYAYLGHGTWDKNFTMLARGLRNSLAMARHLSGTLLQAENSIDFRSPGSPFEELNVLRDGAHYGWPYCYDMEKPAPVWARTRAMDCRSAAHEKPVRLLPPHSAPLSMLYYDGVLFPQLRGHLLMTWHGYEPTGARLVAFAVDPKGIPTLIPRAQYSRYSLGEGVDMTPYPGPASEPLILTPQWDGRAGLRPMGTPVGLAVAEDGAIWVAEDKNAAILRIAPDRP